MKMLKSTVLLLALAALMLSAKIDRMEAQSWPQYRLDLCNPGQQTVYVALFWHYSPNNTWGARGWWTIDGGRCISPGSFIGGPSLYVYAEADDPLSSSGRRLLPGTHPVCIPQGTGKFDREVRPGNQTCRSSERLVYFKEYPTHRDSAVLTLDLWLD